MKSGSMSSFRAAAELPDREDEDDVAPAEPESILTLEKVIDPTPNRLRLARRLLARLEASDDGCIIWTGPAQGNGYGQISIFEGGVKGCASTHRVSYGLFVGPIPPRHDIHHRCENRPCANPEHLQAMTRRDHLLIGRTFIAENDAKTHCANGHEFTPENTRITSQGHRECRRCRLLAANPLGNKHGRDKTHCDRGHEFTTENTQIHHGSRTCVTCARERANRNYHQKCDGVVAKGPKVIPTHCKAGHEYTPENTRIARNGSWVCRTCHRDRERIAQRRKGGRA